MPQWEAKYKTTSAETKKGARQNAKRLRLKREKRWDGKQTNLSHHPRNFTGVEHNFMRREFVG